MWKPFQFDRNHYPILILHKKIEDILTKLPPLNSNYPYGLRIIQKPKKSPVVTKWIVIVFTPILIILSVAGIINILVPIIALLFFAILWYLEDKSNDINYVKICAEYEIELQELKKQEKNYLKEKEEKYDDVYTWCYQRLLINEFLKTVKKPNFKLYNKKGESEEEFEQTLNYWFPERIFTDYSFEAPKGIIPFSPDFIYQDDNNLHIDIEIDEPYSALDGTPLHHLVIDDIYLDSSRNRFFSEKKGWVVVRFAEEQIINQRNECCKVIAHIIYSLTGDEYFSKKLNAYGFPKSIKRWTYEEAIVMARTNCKNRGVGYANKIYLSQNNENYHYKHSDWNEKIKLEDCPNPAADYDLIILSEETKKLLNN